MAATAQLTELKVLTYEEYMAEGESNRQYDIIDGVLIYATSLTLAQHEVRANIMFEGLRPYQRRTRRGKAWFAPCDVLISRAP